MLSAASPWRCSVAADERAATRTPGSFCSATPSSSVIPAAKYASAVSPLRFANGRIASELPLSRGDLAVFRAL
jgi:hypothetical protein